MTYEFKNLNEVEAQDKPTENTTVVAFESGKPKQIPASEFGGKGLVVDLRAYTINMGGDPTIISDMSYDPIYEAITAGKNVIYILTFDGLDWFTPAVRTAVIPDQGIVVYGILPNGGLNIIFTNGSYHSTTETTSE